MTSEPATPHDASHDARRAAPHDTPSHWHQALWILAASLVVRLALGAITPLYADETYYWEWSRQIAFGYFDHPPVVAWMVAAGTQLLGETPLGVRFFAILAGSVGGFAIVRTACHLAGESAARFAALIVALMPLMAGGLALATPDATLFAGVSYALYGVTRAVDPVEEPRAALGYWMLAGVAIGVAMLSKLTGVLVPLGVVLAFAAEPSLRRHFATPGPWLAVAMASLLMLPFLIWNADHDWISFRFQLQHGLGAEGRGNWASREFSLVWSQIGVATPILLGLFVVAVARALRVSRALRAPREPMRFVLATVALTVLLFFIASATRRPVEPNWPAISWMAAIILLASARPLARTRVERWGVGLAGTISVLALAHVVVPYLPVPPRRDPTIKSHGWPALASAVDSARTALAGRAPRVAPAVAVNRYQDAALLAYHLSDRQPVFALNLGARKNQYDLWPQFGERAARGATILLVVDARNESSATLPATIARLAPHFARFERGPLVALARGDAVFGHRRLWVLTGWTGTWPADSTDLLTTR